MLDLLFPLRCPGCGAPAEPICDGCAGSLRRPPQCPPPPGVDRWFAAFAYEGVAAELIARVKYRSTRAVVPWLADAILEVRGTDVAEPDVVTWTPTSRARLRELGVDHAALLARAVAKRLRRPARPLLRRSGGPVQTGAPRAIRAQVEFTARPTAARVLVVDDVTTTGATLAAAARALRATGAREVEAVTAARTPTRRSTNLASPGARIEEPRNVGIRSSAGELPPI